ncbi:MAG: hypothetical protein QOJ33_2200 [Chloroflexota bacterium]|jgi:hypothetical protein|nr:hypothetical protein [Trebonia sp.]MEA2669266.1 hypothetical protein [Chloroflexota bacterium]
MDDEPDLVSSRRFGRAVVTPGHPATALQHAVTVGEPMMEQFTSLPMGSPTDDLPVAP